MKPAKLADNQLPDFRKLEQQDASDDQGLIIGNSRATGFFVHKELPDLGFGKAWGDLAIDGLTTPQLLWVARHTKLDLSNVHVVVMPDEALITLAREGTAPGEILRGYAQIIDALRDKVAPDCKFLIGEILYEAPGLPHRPFYSDGAVDALNARLEHFAAHHDFAHVVHWDSAMDDATNTDLYPDGIHFSELALQDHINPEIQAAWTAWG
jgi:hypothetical protein